MKITSAIRRIARRAKPLVQLGYREPPPPGTELFDGDVAFLHALGPKARVYGEYGCGLSTIWMAKNSTAQIFSVDSSQDWIGAVAAQLPHDRVELNHVDIGPIGNWGAPSDYSKRSNFNAYPWALWSGESCPDLVLIDGRFRVGCFLVSLLEAEPGTHIVFDDYVSRPRYHLVEEYLKPESRSHRQALFVVPDVLDKEAIRTEARAFEMVFN